MASPSPVPGSAGPGGVPVGTARRPAPASAAGTPGPSSTTSRTTSPSTTPTRSSTRDAAWVDGVVEEVAHHPPQLAGVGPDRAGRHASGVDDRAAGGPCPRRLLEHQRIEVDRGGVTAGAPSSAAARTSRSSTSRSISPVAPSTSSRSTSVSTLPGAASASSSETRWAASGPCRSWETSATSRRCRCAEASTPVEHPVHGRGQAADLVASTVVGDPEVELVCGRSRRPRRGCGRAATGPGPAPARSRGRAPPGPAGTPITRVRRSALVASCTASRLVPTTTVTSPSGVSPCWSQTR